MRKGMSFSVLSCTLCLAEDYGLVAALVSPSQHPNTPSSGQGTRQPQAKPVECLLGCEPQPKDLVAQAFGPSFLVFGCSPFLHFGKKPMSVYSLFPYSPHGYGCPRCQGTCRAASCWASACTRPRLSLVHPVQ